MDATENYTPMIDEPLTVHLQAFVPIEIRSLQKQGGVTDWHIAEAQRRMRAFRETPGASESLLYPDKQHTTTGVATLVECLAVLAFIDGGITAFGCHFEATTHNEMSTPATDLTQCENMAAIAE